MQYSLVVPIYNDGALAEDFCLEFKKTFQGYLGIDNIETEAEILFVDDGSRNDSLAKLKELTPKYPFIKVIELSRNFGQHIALSCGYANASGQIIGMLNVDMEDPPNQIPILIDFMKKNDFDIVYGLRRERKSPYIDRLTSRFFHYTLNKLTGYEFPMNTSTLRIMNKKFTDAYNSFNEKSRFLPGLEMWLGFKSGFTPIQHQKRKKGKSSYNFRKRLSMAFEAIISFSDLPLRWVTGFGFAVAIVGFLLNIILVAKKLFFVTMQPGYTSTVSVIILFSGIQMILLGTLGLYVGRILKESQNRPLYIVRNKFNF